MFSSPEGQACKLALLDERRRCTGVNCPQRCGGTPVFSLNAQVLSRAFEVLFEGQRCEDSGELLAV